MHVQLYGSADDATVVAVYVCDRYLRCWYDDVAKESYADTHQDSYCLFAYSSITDVMMAKKPEAFPQ